MGPKIRFFSSFGIAFFGTGAFVPLDVGSVSDLLCDFSFPSYPRFREGTRLTHQQDNDNDDDDADDDVCEHYQGKQIPFSPNRICGLCSTS